MAALTLSGAAVGLVPAIGVGRVVDAVVAGRWSSTAVWAAVVAAAVVVEGAAYVVSDRAYAGAAARVCAGLRTAMYDGLRRRGAGGAERGRYASRFVSDAETVEQLTVATLDQVLVAGFELVAALAALAVAQGAAVAGSAVAIAAGALLLRRLNAAAAAVAERRQQALERMSQALADDPQAFAETVAAVAAADRRLGLLGALSQQGSGVLAGVGPVLVLLVAATAGPVSAGMLLSAYLLAGRSFAAASRLIDVSFDASVARAATRRCLELV